MHKKTLKIGEMSDLFGISKQTLQYYDKIGVFKPAIREENGYRLYYFEQSLQLASILYFKDKGFTLEQIKELNQNLNIGTYFQNINEQYDSIEQEIIRLKELQKATKRKIDFVKDNMNIEDVEKIWVEEKSDRFYYSIGDEAIIYNNKGFYKNPTVVFYEGEDRHFGCYLYGEKNPPSYINGIKIKTIPSARYLCGYHVGGYKTILNKARKMREFRKDLKLAEGSIHFNIIDQFVESDKSKFLTEINIKLL